MKSHVQIVTAIFLLFWNSSSAADIPLEASGSQKVGVGENSFLTLEEAIETMLSANPKLKSYESRWMASRAAVPQAGAWMDPMIGFGLMNVPATSFGFDQEPMTGKKLVLMQRVPYPGKLSAKEDAAGYESSAEEKEFHEVRSRLIAEVKTVYYELFYLVSAIEITEKNRRVFAQFTEIARTRFAVGQGIQQDVLRAEVELSKMDEKLISFRRKRESVEAMMNTLMDRQVDTPIGEIEEITKTPMNFEHGVLLEKAKEIRPVLLAAGERIKKSDAMNRFAKKTYYPDFDMSLAYTQRDELSGQMIGGVDFLSFSVGLSIPLYAGSKQSKKVEETAAMKRMNEEMYSMVLNKVELDLRDLLIKAEEKSELLDLFDNAIIPQAEGSLNSAISGYQVGKVDFMTLVSNEITLFNYELKRNRILADYEKALARLEAVVGEQLF